MRVLHTWLLLIGLAVVSSFLPTSALQSAETATFERDYGTCLINAGLTSNFVNFAEVEQSCGEKFQSVKGKGHDWSSISHCYDAFSMGSMSESASVLIYRGCSSYFNRS